LINPNQLGSHFPIRGITLLKLLPEINGLGIFLAVEGGKAGVIESGTFISATSAFLAISMRDFLKRENQVWY